MKFQEKLSVEYIWFIVVYENIWFMLTFEFPGIQIWIPGNSKVEIWIPGIPTGIQTRV